MKSFTFHPGPRLISGEGCAAQLARLLPAGPCLFATDRRVLRLGLTDACRAALEAEGREIILFDAVELGRRHDVTHVIGFGGGSPMDVAKLAAYLLGSGDDLDEIWGVDIAVGQRLPLALVPTTAGTGSEATPISVITCEGGVKLAVNSRPLIADWAALDAGLTFGLPAHVTAATGIDAIVHSVEAYTSARLKNSLSDALAREAFRLLTGNLLKAIQEPRNVEARSAMLLGAHLAGLAFANAPVAGVHALAYPLGGIHHLPHGLSNALMLGVVLQHNSKAARDLYAELAPILAPECEGQGSQARCGALIEGLDRLVAASGVKPRLRDHSILESDIPLLAKEAMKQTRLLVNNPCPIEEDDARRLYEAAW